jgi:hypothetical protein
MDATHLLPVVHRQLIVMPDAPLPPYCTPFIISPSLLPSSLIPMIWFHAELKFFAHNVSEDFCSVVRFNQ